MHICTKSKSVIRDFYRYDRTSYILRKNLSMDASEGRTVVKYIQFLQFLLTNF